MRQARTAAYWTIPALICLATHWRGFEAWFRSDDFAWLSLYGQIHNFHGLMSALFRPEAQGTIRPWSERAFFIAGNGLFGLNSLPYRVVIFATQFVALALMQAAGWKITGSRAAGFCAALLWTINSSSAEPLGWACVYNEVMCAAFLLGALWMRMRLLESGRRRFAVLEWLVFLLGFGALELNLVYPGLAAAYTWIRARKAIRGTLPMFAVSIAYFALHSWAAPSPKTGVYAMHFGPGLLRTLATYWGWSVGSVYFAAPVWRVKHWMVMAAIALITAGMGAFAIRKLRGGAGAPLFFLAWFLITLGPFLPLSDHMAEYYPYVPAIGLAWLGGWGISESWARGGAARWAAAALAVFYIALSLPRTVRASDWNYQVSMKARDLVGGVARAGQLHPGETILLDGVDEDQFVSAVRDRAFPLIGMDHVYLTPGSEKRLTQNAGWGQVSDYVMAPEVAAMGLEHKQIEVYDASGPTLRNITYYYAATLRASGLPEQVSVSDPITTSLLGVGWYRLETDHRWMGKRATLRMGAPHHSGEKLYLEGYCAEGLGEAQVTVSVNGATLPAAPVHPGLFDLAFPIPDSLAGKSEMQVTVEVSKTFVPPGEDRNLGLSFGTFEVK